MMFFLLGVWQALFVWAVGWVLLRQIPLQAPYGYRLAAAFGLGETTLAYLYFALGMVGGLRTSVLLPLAILLTLLCAPSFLAEAGRAMRRAASHLRRDPLIGLLIGALLGVFALGACVPEREVDSLWYHLAVPQFYIHHGGYIQLVPFNLPSHYPMNVHLHYTLTLLIGNDTTAKTFILMHFLPLLVLLWAVIARYAGARWGLLGVAMLLCCIHWRLPVMANVQRAEYFYVLLSTALLWHAFESNRRASLLLAAVFCGMAMGTKLTAILFAFALQAGLIAIRFGLLRVRWVEGVRWLAIHSLIAWAMLAPWLIKAAAHTGNPFYPALSGLFQPRAEFAQPAIQYADVHGFTVLRAGSVSEWVALVQENVSWMLYNADLIPFLTALALLVIPLLGWKRRLHPWLSAGIALSLFPLLWGHAVARLFSMTYGILVAAIVIALAGMTKRIPSARPLPALLLLAMLFSLIQEKHLFLSSPNINWFGKPALSEEARREWLVERTIVSADFLAMKDWLDQHIPREATLFGYDAGFLYYLDRKVIFSDAFFGEPLRDWLMDGNARRQLERLGVDYVLDGGKTRDAMSDEERQAWERFRDEALEFIHQEGEIRLYRLAPQEET